MNFSLKVLLPVTILTFGVEALPAQARNAEGARASEDAIACLWANVPAPEKATIETTKTPSEFMNGLSSSGPTDAQFTALAKRCGITSNGAQEAGEVAAIAFGGLAIQRWSTQRLSGHYAQPDLVRAWSLVTPEGRDALAKDWLVQARPQPEAVRQSLTAMMTELNVGSDEVAQLVALYAYGTALLENLDRKP